MSLPRRRQNHKTTHELVRIYDIFGEPIKLWIGFDHHSGYPATWEEPGQGPTVEIGEVVAQRGVYKSVPIVTTHANGVRVITGFTKEPVLQGEPENLTGWLFELIQGSEEIMDDCLSDADED